MPGIGGGCPTIHVDIEFFPEGEELLSDTLRELDRLDPALLSSLLDLLAMLINPGQKERWSVKGPMIAGNDVGQDLFVGVPDVRIAIRVINSGGNEVFHSLNRVRFCRPKTRCEPWRRQPRLL